ncbi:MAG: right-handed parallel beta-helix repeat-containing protein [Bacteroidales bacterium]|nr:right-handed parallel beta-helix repeat-containing protein [Bacteroidales bacterium]
MNWKKLFLAVLIVELFTLQYIYGQKITGKTSDPYAVPTFECAGIYWKVQEGDPCRLRYREEGGGTWKNGLVLVYDPRDSEHRGSIVGLKQGTAYQVELSSNIATALLSFQTRSDKFPVGKITVLPAGESDTTIVISESGTPDAYHLVTTPQNSKSVINLKNVCRNGIEINADYVIIRGAEIRNPAIHGIIIRKNRHDIIIEQCYIAFWGRIGGPRTYGNLEGGSDSGVFAETGTSNLTIQRNLIEDPRGASNDWETGHPDGPQGITIIESKGGNVIRYNDIVSTEDHGFNDGIGGSGNFSWTGNMNRDSDIYGNIIRNAWDDAIESEGGNMNVRIWGNFIHFFYNGIATASTSKGPVYIFRNVSRESRSGHSNSMGGALIKTGERNEFGGGRRYIFHNTILQPGGVFNAFSSHVNPNCVTRNNIFDVPGRLATDIEKEPEGDYDFDYFSGNIKGKTAKEEHGIKFGTTPSGTRLYVSSYNLEFYPRSSINSIKWGKYPYEFGTKKLEITDPVVWINNPLIDTGTLLPGFNDNFVGKAPDLGAFEVGSPPLQFGRRAYLMFNEDRAPWEKY